MGPEQKCLFKPLSLYSPWRIVGDCGGAFAMGCIGGALFGLVGGARSAPAGAQRRLMGGLVRMREKGPVLGGQFAAWCLCFTSFECTLSHMRQKEDPWNSIMAGAGAGATMSARNGPMAMAGSAVVGGVLLALIEGVGIVMNKWQAEQMRAPMMEPPQDPSILGPNASSHQ